MPAAPTVGPRSSASDAVVRISRACRAAVHTATTTPCAIFDAHRHTARRADLTHDRSELADQIKEIIPHSGMTFDQVVNDATRGVIRQFCIADAARPCRLAPRPMGTVDCRFSLNTTLVLLGQLEDEELAH